MGLELVTGYRGRLHITAPQDADLYRGLFGDGRVTVGNNMDVTLTAPLEVTVLDGVCLLDGREFFVANEDSVSVECQFDSGTAYLCICYEKDESSGSETADFQILDTYNDMDIRNDPGASQKPLAKLTIEDGVITDVEMMVSMAEPIIDLSRETEDNLEKTDKALEEVDDTLTKINEYFENLSALTERTEKAAEDAENAAERAETVAEDALTGVTVNDVPQEIVDHVVYIIAPDQDEMDKAVTDISALQTENAELKALIAEMEEEISKLNSDLAYASGSGTLASNMDSSEQLRYYKFGRVCSIYFIAVVGSSDVSQNGVTIASGYPNAVATQHGVGRFADGSVVMLRITTGGNIITGYGGSLQAGGTLRACITYITAS